MKLFSDAPVGATSIEVCGDISQLALGGWVVIDSFTDECEVRQIETVSGGTVTFNSLLEYSHSRDDSVEWILEPQIFLSWFGITGDGIETTALQGALYQQYNFAVNRAIWVEGEGLVVTIDQELAVWSDCRIRNLTIKADTSFPFTQAGDEVIVLLYSSNGNPFSLARLYLDNVTIDGNSVQYSRGIKTSLLKPALWNKVRIQKCADYGHKLKGKQAEFQSYEILTCGTGLILDIGNCRYMNFINCNFEDCEVCVKTEKATSCYFLGVYVDQNLNTDNAIAFHLTQDSNNILIDNITLAQKTTQTGFKSEDNNAFIVRSAYWETFAQDATIAIDDVFRGFTRKVQGPNQNPDGYQRYIAEYNAMDIPTSFLFQSICQKALVAFNGRRLELLGGRNPDDLFRATSEQGEQLRIDKDGGLLLPVRATAPPAPVNGGIYYADGTGWNPGSGVGFYGYENGAFVKL